MKSFIKYFLLVCLFTHQINAQPITINNANNTVLPGTSGALNYAQLHATSTQVVFFTITMSGTVFIQNISYGIDGVYWNAGNFRTITSGAHQWSTIGYVPPGTACGISQTITHKFYNSLGQLVSQASYTISTPGTPSLSISGPSNLCSTNSGTYTVSGNNTGTGTYTWNSSNSSFRINGQTFPLTTTSNSVSINATVQGTYTTISVTANGVTGICGSFNTPSKTIQSISTNVMMAGPDCIHAHTSGILSALPTGSTGYTWQYSSNNINWGTPFPQTGSTVSYFFQTPGTHYFRTRRNLSGCVSNWAYWTTQCVPSNIECIPMRKGNEEFVVAKQDINVYPNPSSGKFYVSNTEFTTNYNLAVYDALGKKVEEQREISPRIGSISFGEKLLKGLYTVVLFNEESSVTKKITKEE